MMKKRREFLSNRGVSVIKFPVAHFALIFLMGVSMREIYLSISSDLFIRLFAAGVLTFLIAVLGSVYVLNQKPCEKKICFAFWGSQLLSILCGIGYFFLIEESYIYSANLTQFGVLLLLVFAILLVIAFLMGKDEKKIWYSWTSIFRSLRFGLVAGLLVWGGLSASFKAVEVLFDVGFSYRWYGYIGSISMILLAGSLILNHYVFAIRGLPLGDQDIEIDNSRGMKIFGVYIFMPLAFVYLLIFLAYGAKILILGVWPKGVLVWLGSGFFVWGLLTLYAIYLEKGKFFEIVRKVFLASFIFVALMMAGSLFQRVRQYGISINRYFIGVLILLIIAFSLLSFVFPKYKFRILISLLFGLTLISFYTPLNASNISFWSQKNELESVLLKQNIYLPLRGGSLERLKGDDAIRVSHLLHDFESTYSQSIWKELFDPQCQKDDFIDSYSCLGLDLTEAIREDRYFNVHSEYGDHFLVNIAGYKQLYILSSDTIQQDGDHYMVRVGKESYELDFTSHWEYLMKMSDRRIVDRPVLEIDGGSFKIIINDIAWELNDDGKNDINYFNGYLLLK